MNYTEVHQIQAIVPHPNPEVTRLEKIDIGKTHLVTGKHYRVGDFGIWIKPGAIIPGWLAHNLWLVGKKRSNDPFEVRSISIMGCESPGLWVGAWYKNDKTKESREKLEGMFDDPRSAIDEDGFARWPWWDKEWKIYQILDLELGIGGD